MTIRPLKSTIAPIWGTQTQHELSDNKTGGTPYLIGGVPAALVATAGIFLPSFFMVTVLEPVVGRIRRSAWASPALSGITIAALGLMAGVTIDPGRAAVTDALTAVLALAAPAILIRWRPNGFWPVAAGAIIGIAHALV